MIYTYDLESVVVTFINFILIVLLIFIIIKLLILRYKR